MTGFRFIDVDDDDESDAPKGNGADKTADDKPLAFCNIASWAEHEPPAREWAVLDRFPLRNVALLSGEGSVGKSILLMQLGAAHVLGRDWANTLPEIGPF